MPANKTKSLIERFLQAHDASDADALAELLHEDVVHDGNGVRSIGVDAYRDHLAASFRAFDERWRDWLILVSDDGTRGAAELTARGSYRERVDTLPAASGQSYSIDMGFFFAVEDDRITRVTRYWNAAELARQLGDG